MTTSELSQRRPCRRRTRRQSQFTLIALANVRVHPCRALHVIFDRFSFQHQSLAFLFESPAFFPTTSAATSDGTQDKLISNLRTIFFFVLLVPCAWLAVVGLYWLRRVHWRLPSCFSSERFVSQTRLSQHATFPFTEMPRAAIPRVETSAICCHARASVQVPPASLSMHLFYNLFGRELFLNTILNYFARDRLWKQRSCPRRRRGSGRAPSRSQYGMQYLPRGIPRAFTSQTIAMWSRFLRRLH